jgi:hypothetical protein
VVFVASQCRQWYPTSSALEGRDVSSGFFGSFCLRLSLLAGRGVLSRSLTEERLAEDVTPRGFEAEDMGEAAWDEAMDEDDLFGRAAAGGGEGDGPVFILGRWHGRGRTRKRVPAWVAEEKGLRCWRASCNKRLLWCERICNADWEPAASLEMVSRRRACTDEKDELWVAHPSPKPPLVPARCSFPPNTLRLPHAHLLGTFTNYQVHNYISTSSSTSMLQVYHVVLYGYV